MKARFLMIACSLLTLNCAVAGHHHDRFSISFNTPKPIAPYVTEETQTIVVSDNSHHHHHSSGPKWVDMYEGSPLPANAVVGGSQPNPAFTLFVCRGSYNGGVHPGKLIAGKCNIGWGGQEISLSQYQVLVSKTPLQWVPANRGYAVVNPVEGGYQQDQQLLICQANYRGGIHPGKVVSQMCNIGWGGREIVLPYYNVLIN